MDDDNEFDEWSDGFEKGKAEAQAEIDRWIELCKVHDEIGNTLLADVVSLQAEIDIRDTEIADLKLQIQQAQDAAKIRLDNLSPKAKELLSKRLIQRGEGSLDEWLIKKLAKGE